MIVFKRFIIVYQEIYAMIMLAAFALGGILAAQPAAAQSIPNDGFAGSDIKIPIPDIPILAPSGDASTPQINSNTDMNIIP
jgi:hypothetical protein